MSVLLIPVPVPLSRLTLSQHYRSVTSVAGYTFYPMLPRPFGEPRVSFGVPAHDRTLQLELISLSQTLELGMRDHASVSTHGRNPGIVVVAWNLL
jgi:hypothetical protein